MIRLKIVHVLDLYDQPNNGVATATKRNVKLLRDLGHEVRVLATGEPTADKIVADEFSLPFFNTWLTRRVLPLLNRMTINISKPSRGQILSTSTYLLLFALKVRRSPARWV